MGNKKRGRKKLDYPNREKSTKVHYPKEWEPKIIELREKMTQSKSKEEVFRQAMIEYFANHYDSSFTNELSPINQDDLTLLYSYIKEESLTKVFIHKFYGQTKDVTNDVLGYLKLAIDTDIPFFQRRYIEKSIALLNPDIKHREIFSDPQFRNIYKKMERFANEYTEMVLKDSNIHKKQRKYRKNPNSKKMKTI